MAIVLSSSFFIILMIVVGNISAWRKKRHSSEDYLMSGRSQGKFMVGLSAAASATSGFVVTGAVGSGYTMGLIAVLIPLSWFLGDFVFWTLFPKRINKRARERNYETVPEFVSYSVVRSRDSSIRKLLALIVIGFGGLYAAGQFVAAGKTINVIGDISMNYSIVISGIIILAYSAKGGLESSIPTQFLQAMIMLFTTVGLFVYALYLGDGPLRIINDVREIDPKLLTLDGGKGYLMPIVFLLGFTTAAFTYGIGSPHVLVRIMATKSPEEAEKTRWIYLGFIQITWATMALFGLFMTVLLPEIADPEQALPTFARENLHPIFAGVVMAGIFASVASTLDGQLLVISSSVGVDISPNFYHRMTKAFGVRYQIFVTVIITIIAGILAIYILGNSTIFDITVMSTSALGATIGCAMFISILQWRTSQYAMAVAVIVALVIDVAWRFAGLSEYMIEAFPGFLAGLLTHQLIMLIFSNAKDDKHHGS